MDTMIGVVIVFFIIVIFLAMIPDNKPKEVPDPDQAGKDAIALEVLRKEKTEAEISARDGYSEDKIKEWVDDYVKRAVDLAADVHKQQAEIELLREDVEWFKRVCKEKFGDDWEKETHFLDRAMNKK